MLQVHGLLLHTGSQVLIIEINNNYECICENKMIIELSQDLEHKPIRFNPDG